MQSFGIQVVVGLDDINESSSHIIHFDVHFASQLLQMKFHLAVIGVGHDVEVGLACSILFIYAKERGLEVYCASITVAAVTHNSGKGDIILIAVGYKDSAITKTCIVLYLYASGDSVDGP